MTILRLLLLLLILYSPAVAAPLTGYVSNNAPLCPLRAKLDGRNKTLHGQVSKDRGVIGIFLNKQTGQIDYIYPESGLIALGINVGDFIIKVEKELYLPCLTPDVVIYPSGYIMNLTIRSQTGQIRTIPVKLIPRKNIVGT